MFSQALKFLKINKSPLYFVLIEIYGMRILSIACLIRERLI